MDIYDIALTYSFASMKNRFLNFGDPGKSNKTGDVIDEASIIYAIRYDAAALA
jgi:hypothetical protein